MLTVCNFHYIRTTFEAPFPSIFGVTPKEFENQLLLLSKMGEFINQEMLITEIDAVLSSKSNYILITFDDGLKEQFLLAKPILSRLNIPAIYYINSINFIEKEVSLVHKNHLLRSIMGSADLLKNIDIVFPDNEFSLTESEINKAELLYKYDSNETAYLKYLLNFKLSSEQTAKIVNALFSENFDSTKVLNDLYMNTEQLEELSHLNMLGNHTHSHLALGLQSPEKIYDEILKTKNFIDNFGHSKQYSISYPYGSGEACQDPVDRIAKDLGFNVGFTMEKGINDKISNNLLLKRFDCNDLPGGKFYKATS